MRLITVCFAQYACDVQAEVVGKPSAEFFQSVLRDMDLQPHEVTRAHTHLSLML